MTHPRKLATAVLAAALMVPLGASAGLQSDGTWKIERGDTLYAVARKLAPGNSAEQARLRKYMVKNSPSAFVNGDPGRMEVGKTLNLPEGSDRVNTDGVGDIKLSTVPMPSAKPSAGSAAPEITPDMSFSERLDAKRKAREEAEKKSQLERRQQEMAAAEQRKAEAAQRAEAERRRAEQERQRQQQQAAERARQEAARRQAAAAQASQPRPAPKPQAAADVNNPYVLCPSLNYSGRCGYWR